MRFPVRIAIAACVGLLLGGSVACAQESPNELRPGDSVLVRTVDDREYVGTVLRSDAESVVVDVGGREVSIDALQIAQCHRFEFAPSSSAGRRRPPPVDNPETRRLGSQAMELSLGTTALGWTAVGLLSRTRDGDAIRGLVGVTAVVGVFVGPGFGLMYAGETGRAVIGTLLRGAATIVAFVGLVLSIGTCGVSSSSSVTGGYGCGNGSPSGGYVAAGGAALFLASSVFDIVSARHAPGREAARREAAARVFPWAARDRGGVVVALRF